MSHFYLTKGKRVCTFLLIIISILSCSGQKNNVDSEDVNVDKQLTEDYLDLFKNLDALNLKEGISIDSRSHGLTSTRLKDVAFADLTGFITGALFGSNIGSGGFAVFGLFGAVLYSSVGAIFFSSSSSSSFNLPELEQLSQSQIQSLNIGELHNYFLQEIYEMQDSSLDSLSDKQILNYIYDRYYEINQDSTAIDTTALYQTLASDLVSIRSGEIMDTYQQVLVNNIEDSRIRTINYYIQSASTLSNPNIINYTHNYIAIVNESLIPSESKRFINGGVSLASSSLIFWGAEDD